MKTLSLYNHILKIALGIILIITVSACRKEIPQGHSPEGNPALSFSEVFDSFWTGMNNNYVFWDIDPTDWDQVYRTYKPKFANLKMEDSTDVKLSFKYFKEMTAGLVDGHYSIQFNSPYLRDSLIDPGYARHMKSPDFHLYDIDSNFFFNTILDKRIGKANGMGVRLDTSSTFSPVRMVAGKINKDILYLYFSDCAVKINYENDMAKKLLDYFFTEIKQSDLRGIILDVRGNGGGNTEDVNFLLGHLTDRPYVFARSRGKGGIGRLDYTGWIDVSVQPTKDAKAFNKPIIILADQSTGSAAESTVMAVRAFPGGKGRFVGERTIGAHGPRLGSLPLSVISNSGPFRFDMAKSFGMGAQEFRYIDGKNTEGIGITPDVEVKYNKAALDRGEDPQLDKAISLIP